MAQSRHWVVVQVVVMMVVMMVARCQDSDEFYRLVYNVTEEQEAGVFVGNTALDTGLFSGNQNFQDLRFTLFAQGNDKARYFSLDERSGVIRTSQRIDREEVCGQDNDCTMILDLAVYRKTSPQDSFDFYRSIQVAVRVEDKNDNPPSFLHEVITLSVPENMGAPYRLYTSPASDADGQGPNSDLSYHLETQSDLFDLQVTSQENGLTDLIITVNQALDREAQDSYYVTIVASDSGSPRQSGSVLVNIAVTDQNDNTPVFLSSNYSVHVPENASLHEPILTVSAQDHDVDDNGQVVYQLSSRVGPEIRRYFAVGESDGRVSLLQSLDYEKEAKFVFLIEARDRGDPPRSSSASVVVSVVDVNDNAPRILLTLSPEGTDLVEHEAPGRFLGHIAVSDQDSGVFGTVFCEVDDDSFGLEPFVGQKGVYKVVVARELDHEDQPVRQVTIRCHDGDTPPLQATATFQVKVIDVNDNPPTFRREVFTGFIQEEQSAGAPVMAEKSGSTNDSQSGSVLMVMADDPDSGELGRVTYSIPGPSNFTINSLTGTVRARVGLDRETQGQYSVPLLAVDHGDPKRSATATLLVTVLDINDHPPQFAQPIFFLEVSENQPPGSPCGVIQALDGDSGPSARMEYSIVSTEDEDGSRFFSVDEATGEVRTRQMLDRELRDSYTFFMEVHNPDNPHFRDSAQVMVSVLDDNDHAPVITNPTPANSSITIPNNTTVGSLLLTVRAQDGDGPDITDLEFSLEGADRNSLFQVITVSGDLILTREIRHQDARTHTLLLVVSDGGSKPRSSTATLLLTIPAEGLKVAAEGSILQQPNFIIIVSIVALTVLVAALVLSVICCVFRKDKKRRNGRQQQRQVKDKLYQAAQWVSTHSLPAGGDTGADFSPHVTSGAPGGMGGGAGEKKGRKEVSFSLEEDPMEKDPDTSGSLGSVFTSPIPATQDNNNLKSGMDGGQLLTFTSGMTSPGSCRPPRPVYESSDGHTYANTPPIAETDERGHMQLDKVGAGGGGEDALSASSGETGTDSGRGGSEDEAAHRTSTSGDSDSRSLQPSGGYLPFSTASADRSHNRNRKPPSLSSLPEEHHHPHPHPLSQNLHHQQQHQQHPTYFRSSSEQLGLSQVRPGSSLASRGFPYSSGRGDPRSDPRSPTGTGLKDGGSYHHSMDRKAQQDRASADGGGSFNFRESGSGGGGGATGSGRLFHTFGPQYQQHRQPAGWRSPQGGGSGGGWGASSTTSLSPSSSGAGGDHHHNHHHHNNHYNHNHHQQQHREDDDLTTTSGSYTLTPEDCGSPQGHPLSSKPSNNTTSSSSSNIISPGLSPNSNNSPGGDRGDAPPPPFHQMHDIMV